MKEEDSEGASVASFSVQANGKKHQSDKDEFDPEEETKEVPNAFKLRRNPERMESMECIPAKNLMGEPLPKVRYRDSQSMNSYPLKKESLE